MTLSHVYAEKILPFINISSEQKLAVKAWWKAFDKDQRLISDSYKGRVKEPLDIPAWMNQYLHPIDKDIMWEFGPGIKKAHRLVITSETTRLLHPLVQYVLSQAPEYKDWEFYEYRLVEDLDDTQLTMNARANWQDISEIKFELLSSKFNTLGIVYYIPASWDLEKKERHSYNAYILTESLLGEEILDKWVDYIEVQVETKNKPSKRIKNSAQPLSNLKKLSQMK